MRFNLRATRFSFRRHGVGTASLFLLASVATGAGLAACGESESNSLFNNGNSTVGPDASITDPGTGFGDGDGGTSTGNPVATALVFDPPSAEIIVDGSGTPTHAFKLKATFADGSTKEVQAESLQFDRPDVATVTPGAPVVVTAIGTFAGVGVLHAIYGGAAAAATVSVIIHAKDLSGVDGAVISKLDGANNAADTVVTKDNYLYPYDKTVYPLGLTVPLLMWPAPRAADVYRVRLAEKNFIYDFYGQATMPGQLRLPQAAWDRVTASNGGASDPITITVSRWDQPTNTAFTSVTRTMTIAQSSVRGAIYYWTASQIPKAGGGVTRVGSITRIRPGSGATPVKLNEGRCMGCHSVSADGTTMVATVEDPSAPSVPPYSNWSKVRAWASFKVPDGTLTVQTNKSGANSALTPDGKYVVFGGKADTPTPGSKYISLATTSTGNVIANSGLDDVVLPLGGGIMMPAFSPDGKKLAFVEANGDYSDNVIPSPSRAIRFLDFDQSIPRFNSTLHQVALASDFAATNQGLGYPSFTPSSDWVAYHTGPNSTGCFDVPSTPIDDNCNDLTPDRGEIWMSSTDGAKRIRLDALNDPPAAADRYVSREPTFNPVERGNYSWVVFTSMRDWGNKLTGPAINGKRRLWVAAIDKTIGTVDPSHPAFYLEGQENTPNMRGFWSLAQCTATPAPAAPDAGVSTADGGVAGACTAGFECCSGFCDRGVCVEPTSLACQGAGDSCTTVADCCNATAVECTHGKCTPSIPK